MPENRAQVLGNSDVKSNGDMTVADLACLTQSLMATYQLAAREDFEELRVLITSLTLQLSKFRDEITALTSRLSTLREDITSDMAKLREENQRTLSTFSSMVNKATKTSSLAYDRSTRMNDLVVSGIPFIDGEDLLSYFHEWCRSLEYIESKFPLVDIRRLPKGNMSTGTMYIILLKFAITVQRNEFYSRYLRSRSLSLSGIGFSASKRIYINENLEPSTRVLRSKALRMKKEGRLDKVFTRAGILFVKRSGEEKEIAVSSESDFNRFV